MVSKASEDFPDPLRPVITAAADGAIAAVSAIKYLEEIESEVLV